MAVKMRLKRMGKKKQPTYRVVVADSRAPRDGRIIELLGRYDPRQEPSLVEIDNERAQYWLSTGAQPTDRVRKLLEISGAVARAKVSRSGVYRLEDDAPPPPPAAPPPESQASQASPESEEIPESEESRESPQATGEETSEAAPDAHDAPVAGQAPADGPDQAPSPESESVEPATGTREENIQAENTQAESEKQEGTQ